MPWTRVPNTGLARSPGPLPRAQGVLRDMAAEGGAAAAITDSMIRISLGLEDVGDSLDVLRSALAVLT